MGKSFRSLEAAVNAVVESSFKHEIATENGDYKTANKNYNVINKAVLYLKENNGIANLKELLNSDEVSVKLWVASYLIRDDDPQAISVLKDIASKSIRHHSYAAELILEGWRK